MTSHASVLTAALMTALVCLAAAGADALFGAAGRCENGTHFYIGAEQEGACGVRHGARVWYDGMRAAKWGPGIDAMPAETQAGIAGATTAAVGAAFARTERFAAPLPGADEHKVWAHAEPRVYYCSDDGRYGKTFRGEYLTEFDANARGFIPEQGKPCH